MSTSTVTSVETGLPIRVTPVDEVSLEARLHRWRQGQ